MIVDVHAHYLPDDYRSALVEAGHANPDGFPILPRWSADQHIETMDQVGIDFALLSVSSPGVGFGGDPIEWARRVNEAGAATVDAHPARFGLLATLPLPDVAAALAELEYASDVLAADGVVLLTNTDGLYLGERRFEPVFEELDRRRTVVFLHPTSPADWRRTALGYPRPILEFLLDTTRTVANLVLNGTLQRHPDVRLIVPHAGAALPVLADRIAGFAAQFPLGEQDPGAIDVTGTLQRLHYDVAGFPLPRQLRALLDLVAPSQVLYGSDFPFGRADNLLDHATGLRETDLVTDGELAAVLHGNAAVLFPRLRGG